MTRHQTKPAPTNRYVIWTGTSLTKGTEEQARAAIRAGHYVRSVATEARYLAEYGPQLVTTRGRRPKRFVVTLPAAEWADNRNMLADVRPAQATQRRSRTA